MGCCASTNKSPPLQNSLHISDSGNRKSPPSYPLIEEETVKEVLSETPTTATFPENHRSEIQFIETVGFSRNGAFLEKPFAAFGNDEPSEVASSTEMKESIGDEFHEIRRRSPTRLRNRSSSGEAKREKTVGKCPGWRSQSSPGRNGHRPDIGRRRESSERRQRSPAMSTGSGSGSWAKRTRQARSGSGERIRKVDEGKQIGENTWLPTSSELLENPLVSLECFIFL